MTSLIETIDFRALDLDSRFPKADSEWNFRLGSSSGLAKPIWLQSRQPQVKLKVDLVEPLAVKFFWLPQGRVQQTWQVEFNLQAPGISLEIYSLSNLQGREEIHNHLQINHLAPDCQSFTLFKAVLKDQAKSDFRGKIFVRPEAHQTDAKLGNHTVLLSDEALADSNPDLEIYCDDVKCTHGATIGHFDDIQNFYLQTRGIAKPVREQMLTRAFLGEVAQKLTS